jgi:NAD(P)-dependent dehydrogenase (short-subunit alcohol dehydrogenase family)
MESTMIPGGSRLAGKRAIVVGAGQVPNEEFGMGRASAVLFAREGAKVLVVDRVADRAEATSDLIRAEGNQAVMCVADITSADDCQRLIDEALCQFGGIDVLQNTVGILGSGDPTDVDDEEWDRVLDTNLTGMWRTTKLASAAMRAQRSGSVINYSSVAAMQGRSNGIYGVTKSAVNTLTTTLATFNGPYNVRVNAIMPGLLVTPMAFEAARQAGRDWEEAAEERLKVSPMGFFGDAWDCARLGVFLASEESRYISGACIPVDGAYSSGTFYSFKK